MVLDLDTEQELSEQESASSTSGKGDVGSSMNDLDAAGSIILKLIVVNCSTMACDDTSFLSVVHRLAATEVRIRVRVLACSLSQVLWSHLDFPRQLQLRGVITRALHDVKIIVWKSTAVVLHDMAELVFDRRAIPWLVLMCKRSMTDPEPQLRAAVMTMIIMWRWCYFYQQS